MAKNLKLVRYYGSKGGMWKELLKFFPQNYKAYIEAFGGSATMLFCQKAEVEVYNDLEQNVYSLFKVVSSKKAFKESPNTFFLKKVLINYKPKKGASKITFRFTSEMDGKNFYGVIKNAYDNWKKKYPEVAGWRSRDIEKLSR